MRAALCLLALCCARARAADAGGGQPAKGEAAALSPDQEAKLRVLERKATSRDPGQAMAAVEQIEAMGSAARDRLRQLLNRLLLRNKGALEAAARAVGDPKRAEPLEKKLAELRAEALANIAKLKKDDDSLTKAAAYYRKLMKAASGLSRTLAARDRLLQAIGLRLRLLAAGRRVAAGAAAAIDAPTEKALRELAGQRLGASLKGIGSFDELREAPSLRGLRDYRRNRRLEAYNRRLARRLDAEEWRNVSLVNTYREALGLRRLEVDLRLVKAARQHSKEMKDLGYFSHDSPVQANKSPSDRCRRAGYPSPGGENIAGGSPSGPHAFWQWFHSPGHHQNMVGARFTAIGVGRWHKLWTQAFGLGKPLAFADEAAGKSTGPTGPAVRKRP
jgi:uncharacterized protein YkwD